MSKNEEQGLNVSKQRYQLIPRTLVFIFRQREVLLLKGAPDKKIWANLYNGIGGHIERGEDLRAAAAREVAEETGLQVANLQFCGAVNIDAGDAAVGIGMFVFCADYTGGALTASHEGRLDWIPLDALGDYPLVGDIPVLLAQIDAQRRQPGPITPFFGRYWYENDHLCMELDGVRLS